MWYASFNGILAKTYKLYKELSPKRDMKISGLISSSVEKKIKSIWNLCGYAKRSCST